MSILTTKQFKNLFSDNVEVEQFGSKRFWVVKFTEKGSDYYHRFQFKEVTLAYSYKTIVGVKTFDTWFLTLEKFSVTTSKQLTQFANSTQYKVQRINALEFEALLHKLDKQARGENEN